MRAYVWTAVFLTLITVGEARAQSLIGDVLVPFSAERTVVWKDKTYTGEVHAVPGKQRHDQQINGLHIVAILRADTRTAYLMLPDMHLYTALPFPDAVTGYGGFDRLGKPIGQADRDGQQTAEYHVQSHGSDGSTLDVLVWLTRDHIPMRIEGDYADAGQPSHHGSLELSHIQKGPQDPALFEVPPGMTRIDPDAVESLFNLRLPKLK